MKKVAIQMRNRSLKRSKLLAFMRKIASGATARCDDGEYFTLDGGRRGLSLPRDTVLTLAGDGVIQLRRGLAAATPETRNWLRRQLAASGGEFQAQHQHIVKREGGASLNSNEGPLLRLAQPGKNGECFLQPHHLEAGVRLEKLVDRANLVPKVTASYGNEMTLFAAKQGSAAGDISDMASDARRQLQKVLAKLPGDCAGIVVDVCGFGKGLQLIERERRWPRRSAKLVLRIGLDHLAMQFGLAPEVVGSLNGQIQGWRGEGAGHYIL